MRKNYLVENSPLRLFCSFSILYMAQASMLIFPFSFVVIQCVCFCSLHSVSFHGSKYFEWMDRNEMAGNIFSDYWLSIIPLSSACVRQIFDTFRLLILALETAEWNVSLLYFCFCFAIWFVLPFDLITHTETKETKTEFPIEKGIQIHIE